MIEKLIDELYQDFNNGIISSTEIEVDGKTCRTDVGYAFEGVDFFVERLKDRLKQEMSKEIISSHEYKCGYCDGKGVVENIPIVSGPSPCKDCGYFDKESCCGCKAYFEWRKKYDD